ncbi:MAG: TIGR01244 family sulfur transferase [Pacificimonas sp.]
MTYTTLDDRAAAAPQISATDISALKEAGFRAIICNRPDHEDPGQPTSAEIEAAAEAAGLAYALVPLGREPLTPALIERMRAALDDLPGPVLLYCRSGTRSTTLWALAEASRGRAADELIRRAAQAGYDLGPYRAVLTDLAKRAG